MKKELKERAKKIFEKSKFDKLYVNPKGEFFSEKNLAVNSVLKVDEVSEITRSEAFKTVKAPKSGTSTNKEQAPKKLIVETTENQKLCFVDLKEGQTPKEGDKAKLGNKNADGEYKINPQLSYTFEKGILKKITKAE